VAGRAVVIEDYDPGWPLRFAELCVPLREALGPLALRIEHVGSTAIPGLAAKPVIDMDVVIPSRRDLPEAIRRLAVIGYEHRGDLGIRGREAFANPAGLPEHHLYVCDRENAELRRHLLFRDHLRSHPAEAAAYAALKRTLAERFGADRDGYSLAKSDFVLGVLTGAEGGAG
jgi:GrpB-like predicted nucleotidyltransferase (UPF0157 family)